MPTCAAGGLSSPSIVRMPSFALFRSVHVPPAPVGEHIDPVRSIASTMSTGVDAHGLQALACVATLKWLMPKIFANQVLVLAVPETVSWFGLTAALQPTALIAVAVQDTW